MTVLERTDAVAGCAGPAEDCLGKITAYVLEHGLADASLRKMAAVAGTSHRMLTYYFGSREGVLGAVAGRLRDQHRKVAEQATTRRAALETSWREGLAPEMTVQGQLFFYLAGLATVDATGQGRFVDGVVSTWIDVFTELGVAEGVEPGRAQIEARLLTAGLRGLTWDWFMTRDDEQLDASFALLLDAVLGPA